MSQEGKQQPFEGNVLSPSEEPEESKSSGQAAKSLKRNVLILGISGGFLLIIGTLVLSSMNRREEREQRQQAVRQEEEQKKLAAPDPKRVEQEADRRLEDAERRQQEEAKAQTTPLPLSDPTSQASQQPTLAPAPREDQVDEKPEQPDPWAQARQNFRQQDAQQYYQGIMSARSAPIFFGSGAPSGRRGARAASERSQEEMYRPAQTEEEFYANLRAGQEQARREQARAVYANAPSSQGSNNARVQGLGHPAGLGSNESFFLGQTELQRGQSAYQGTPSGDYIEAGTLVHVVLETGVSSQLPGQVIARVAQPVWNRSVDKIVVPAGSKVLGLYNANVSKGQNRVQVAWTKLILPNGKSISLANLSGVALSGKSGLLARSDEHWDKILTGVALSGVFSATAAVLAGPTNSFNVNPRQQAIYGAAQPIQRTGEEIATRYLDVQPELTIAPGERVGLLTTQDVALP